MSVLDKVILELPGTRTYRKREVEWFGVRDGEWVMVLTRCVKEFRSRAKLWRECYHVQEEPAVGTYGRVFLVLKTTDIEVSEPYRVALGPHGNACTCTAGQCCVPGDDATDGCIHRDALAMLIEQGEL